ncbi:hypothetical protein [Paenarthrobacter sp. PH39-S1]|uniref:hypothetical protein n=1 Tax=Paenarthrobacter sp. PH39-S1 TaxID=3046204 RepID=UPI0024BA3DE5|nr:hypothetical protein [Paenarthrobacter sp. PH39-S1]MDJ0355135.1 hypothetical protein [Paenarthrobacter sp. PH39-S1]
MSAPDEEPRTGPKATPGLGHYGEISPGVPRYGQYAPPGYQRPAADPAPAKSPRSGRSSGPDEGTTVKRAGEKRAARQTPPRQVEIAFRLILGAGVIEAMLVVLGAIAMVTPGGQSTARQMLLDAGLKDASLLQPLLITAVVLSTAAVGIYVLIAFQIRKGRNWARITGAVLAALSLLSLLQPDLITAAQMLLGIVAMVLLFRGPAKDYFRR